MYETEYSTLLALLGSQVGGPPCTCAVTDHRTLILLAKQHSVMNILYFALKDDPALPPECLAVLEKNLFSTAHQQLGQEMEFRRVADRLNKENIRFLPMKGALIRALYPAPEMRTSCDVDMYYDKTARPRMDDLFASLGYEKEEADPNHTAYKKGNVTFEMHHNLLTDVARIDRYYRNLWDRLIPDGGSAYRMRDEDVYIYHIVHAMKHFTEAGTGIRSVLDGFVFLHAKSCLDWEYLQKELDSIGLWDFHLVLSALGEAWFGGAAMPGDLLDVSAYILGSGTYGNTVHKVANRSARGGKLGFFLSRAFPSYHYMAEKYPSLRRFPPALPFYWAWRMIRALFHKDNRIAVEMGAAGSADKETEKQLAAVMDRVGLRGYR